MRCIVEECSCRKLRKRIRTNSILHSFTYSQDLFFLSKSLKSISGEPHAFGKSTCRLRVGGAVEKDYPITTFGHPEVYIGRIEGIFCLEWLRTKLPNSVIRWHKLRAYFALSCVRSYTFLSDIVYLITYRPQGFYLIVKTLFKYPVRRMITAGECSIKKTTNNICVLKYSMYPQRDMVLTA